MRRALAAFVLCLGIYIDFRCPIDDVPMLPTGDQVVSGGVLLREYQCLAGHRMWAP